MPYWRLFYHIVWATYRREPFISPDIEAELLGYLRGKAVALGATVHAINAMPDHVHLAASVPPTISLASFIGALKGSSSHHMGRSPQAPSNFRWQAEYSAVSFGERALARVAAYVRNQKKHHEKSELWSALELAREGGGIRRSSDDDGH